MDKLKIIPIEVPWKISAAEGIGEYKGNAENLTMTFYCGKSRKKIKEERARLKENMELYQRKKKIILLSVLLKRKSKKMYTRLV